MYNACIKLKDGSQLHGYIDSYTAKYITKKLRRFTLNRHMSFDLYEREPKTDNNTGWRHKCYVEVKKQNILLFTYWHVSP